MDTPFLAMKFGKYDNLLSFQKGEMYMKNFGFFRGNEIAVEPGQKDWYDAKFLSQEWPVTAYDDNNNPIFTATASLTIDDKMNEHIPVFCMFMLNHNNIVESGNEQCVMEFTPEQKSEMKNQFGLYYREWAERTKATMRIHHKPGEKMEVDWAGNTMSLRDNLSGGEITVYIFVAVLPCSGYAYVEGFLSQKLEAWIAAHVNAYRYFGGVTRILVPDNLKTGVTSYTVPCRIDRIGNAIRIETLQYRQDRISKIPINGQTQKRIISKIPDNGQA